MSARDLQIVRISRMGDDYAVHFADGTYALFAAEDFEPMLTRVATFLLQTRPANDFYVH